jgi:hypothetical protein
MIVVDLIFIMAAMPTSTKQSNIWYGLGHGIWHGLKAWPSTRMHARRLSRPNEQGHVLVTGLEHGLSAKQNDGNGLKHGRLD